jgi:hypothetical protein
VPLNTRRTIIQPHLSARSHLSARNERNPVPEADFYERLFSFMFFIIYINACVCVFVDILIYTQLRKDLRRRQLLLFSEWVCLTPDLQDK